MAVWETVGDEPGLPVAEAEFAEVWRALDKGRVSRTLAGVWAPRTRLDREFDAEAVRRMKQTATGEISVSGPDLAQYAFRAGLVDELHVFVFPVVGGGKSGLPRNVRLNLAVESEPVSGDQRLELGVGGGGGALWR